MYPSKSFMQIHEPNDIPGRMAAEEEIEAYEKNVNDTTQKQSSSDDPVILTCRTISLHCEQNFLLPRDFGYLRSRVLLHMQEGIAALERESDDLDTSDSICQPVHRRIRIGEPSHKYDHKSEDENSRMLHQPDAERPRHTILSDIEAKLLENDDILMKDRDMSAFQRAARHDHRSVTTNTNDKAFSRCREDIVDLRQDPEMKIVKSFGVDVLARLYLQNHYNCRMRQRDRHLWRIQKISLFLLSVLPITICGAPVDHLAPPESTRQILKHDGSSMLDIDVSLQKSPSVVQWIISHASPILVLFMCASTALIITYYAKKYPQERRGYFLCAAAMSAFMTIEFSTPETHFLERVFLSTFNLYFGFKYALVDRRLLDVDVMHGLFIVAMSFAFDIFIINFLSGGSREDPMSLFATLLTPSTVFSIVVYGLSLDIFWSFVPWLNQATRRVANAFREPQPVRDVEVGDESQVDRAEILVTETGHPPV
ncbi:hypothetical protein EV356DRAFT_309659 [Viridothelium virens]|uniref:DUF6594 domain-containing protein n=1 Tax=Viridothelium virens TaxID=1048519 RepID=A0A6A6HK94_VIRVR|nr:hypothetical protein EV356DRAFT_309659 [Viridothelium virens]